MKPWYMGFRGGEYNLGGFWTGKMGQHIVFSLKWPFVLKGGMGLGRLGKVVGSDGSW